MKIYALFTMACWLAFVPSSGKILNGYEKDIASARSSALHLRKLPRERNVRRRLEKIEEFILYYELTNALLERFQKISPSLYAEIDTIEDRKGRRVNVFVRFIPRNKSIEGTLATTNINQMDGDEHASVSEYGSYTVSVYVVVAKHSLAILAHEFGHVSHQVPNLASYIQFFKRNYTDRYIQAEYLGHKPGDPSGQKADTFERQFRKEAQDFHVGTKTKPIDPFVVRADLAKMVLQRNDEP